MGKAHKMALNPNSARGCIADQYGSLWYHYTLVNKYFMLSSEVVNDYVKVTNDFPKIADVVHCSTLLAILKTVDGHILISHESLPNGEYLNIVSEAIFDAVHQPGKINILTFTGKVYTVRYAYNNKIFNIVSSELIKSGVAHMNIYNNNLLTIDLEGNICFDSFEDNKEFLCIGNTNKTVSVRHSVLIIGKHLHEIYTKEDKPMYVSTPIELPNVMIDTLEVCITKIDVNKDLNIILSEVLTIDFGGGLWFSQFHSDKIQTNKSDLHKVQSNLKFTRFVCKRIQHIFDGNSNGWIPDCPLVEDINGSIYPLQIIVIKSTIDVEIKDAIAFPTKFSLNEYRPGMKPAF